jgi:NodT family efflux transporter outer membrane factor (OMF) lipoprotein
MLFTALSLTACSHSAISPEVRDLAVPSKWARDDVTSAANLNWLSDFESPVLTDLVAEALGSNYRLEQERIRVAQAEQSVVIVGANKYPQLDMSLGAARRGVERATDDRATFTTYDMSLDARWELDLWGKLSKRQQSAQLSFLAQQAQYKLAERELVAGVARGLFSVIKAQQLLEVADRRLNNVKQSEEIVASGYRQGLNDALDLYLARNQVERQEANLAQQGQLVLENTSALQIALARYPDGQMELGSELPIIAAPLPTGIPSELLLRRADIEQAWLELLAADAELAAAHKARFPSLSLVGGGGTASSEFSELLNGDDFAWSLIGSLSQPLFQGGRLKAQEKQARERVHLLEQQYLDLVFRAFADVENAISRNVSLRSRYESILDAETNSAAALTLALEQYQRGLIAYTTVLESQRQAFDAEAQVVELRNQLLQNRIDLYFALGGEFSTGADQTLGM